MSATMIQDSVPEVRESVPPRDFTAWNPLIVALGLLTFAGVAAFADGAGVDSGRALQFALLHAELAACVLLLFPGRGVVGNLLSVTACFFVASAVALLLSFAAPGGPALESRAAALGVWLFCGGVLALGARLGGEWILRGRLLLLCLFALPALAHYLALEYGGASLLHLRPFSPNWALAAGQLSWLPLLPASLLPWAAAFVLARYREAP